MFKFELSDTIYYFRNNQIHCAPVLSRMLVENEHPDWNSTNVQKEMYQPFGVGREVYATCHGLVTAEEAFGSARELAERLIKDAGGE